MKIEKKEDSSQIQLTVNAIVNSKMIFRKIDLRKKICQQIFKKIVNYFI